MILVTGATGNVGRPTVRELLKRGAAVRVFVRDESRLGDVANDVDVVVGGFDDESALSRAMQGVDRMYLHAIGDSNEEVAAAMKAAKSAGVEHVAHLSSLSASLPGPANARWFLGRESLVTEAGLDWTMLRGGFFMSNVLRWVKSINEEGKVRWIRGRFAPVDTRDIGAVAAAVLTESDHASKVYDLTGPEIMDSAGQVGVMAEVLGRPIDFQEISVNDVVAELRAGGAPEERIEFAKAVGESLADDNWAVVTDTIEQVTGRKPGTFRQWCNDYAGAFD